MKQAANIITLSRIPLSIGILFTTVFSPLFYVLYVVAGISDILDGIVARKMHCETELGSKLDSIADIVMVAVCMVKILPVIDVPLWMGMWIGAIAAIRLAQIIFTLIRRKRFVMQHTLMNKATGLALFLLPLILPYANIKVAGTIVCVLASLAAEQDWYILLVKTDDVT